MALARDFRWKSLVGLATVGSGKRVKPASAAVFIEVIHPTLPRRQNTKPERLAPIATYPSCFGLLQGGDRRNRLSSESSRRANVPGVRMDLHAMGLFATGCLTPERLGLIALAVGFAIVR